ncbi:hypothetical protein V1511DRAFT_188049 [Dipodascopsis uninucleata]
MAAVANDRYTANLALFEVLIARQRRGGDTDTCVSQRTQAQGPESINTLKSNFDNSSGSTQSANERTPYCVSSSLITKKNLLQVQKPDRLRTDSLATNATAATEPTVKKKTRRRKMLHNNRFSDRSDGETEDDELFASSDAEDDFDEEDHRGRTPWRFGEESSIESSCSVGKIIGCLAVSDTDSEIYDDYDSAGEIDEDIIESDEDGPRVLCDGDDEEESSEEESSEEEVEGEGYDEEVEVGYRSDDEGDYDKPYDGESDWHSEQIFSSNSNSSLNSSRTNSSLSSQFDNSLHVSGILEPKHDRILRVSSFTVGMDAVPDHIYSKSHDNARHL